MSESDKDDDEIATKLVIVDHCKIYKLLDLQAFIIIRAPLETLIMSFSPVYLYLRASWVSKEMRLFFKSGTYQY